MEHILSAPPASPGSKDDRAAVLEQQPFLLDVAQDLITRQPCGQGLATQDRLQQGDAGALVPAGVGIELLDQLHDPGRRIPVEHQDVANQQHGILSGWRCNEAGFLCHGWRLPLQHGPSALQP